MTISNAVNNGRIAGFHGSDEEAEWYFD
jgi:hypothetical protein